MFEKVAYPIISPIFVARNNRLFLKLIENAVKAQQKALLTILSFLSSSSIEILGLLLSRADRFGGRHISSQNGKKKILSSPCLNGKVGNQSELKTDFCNGLRSALG